MRRAGPDDVAIRAITQGNDVGSADAGVEMCRFAVQDCDGMAVVTSVSMFDLGSAQAHVVITDRGYAIPIFLILFPPVDSCVFVRIYGVLIARCNVYYS